MRRLNAEQIQTRLSAGSKKRLKSYVKRLASDSDVDIFDKGMKKLLDEYVLDKSYLEKVCSHLRKGEFSQSRKKYSDLLPAFQRFASDDYTSFRWNQNYKQAKENLIKQMSGAHLKALDYKSDSDILSALPKKSTHAGWTFVESGKRKKGDNLSNIFKRFKQKQKDALLNGSWDNPILCGVRTQCTPTIIDEKGNFIYDVKAKHKTRLISMMDLFTILEELRTSKPFQDFIGKLNWYAGGKSDRELLLDIRDRFSVNGEWIVLDYSSFDQTISSWLIYDAFDIIEAAFDDIGGKEHWMIMKQDFVNKCFIDGDGEVVYSKKGVPSGSMWTQIIDSIVNKLMIETFMLSKEVEYNCLIMGDDNLIFFPTSKVVKKDDVCSYLSKNFGMIVNEDKSTSSDEESNPEFLSRFWTAEGTWRHPSILIAKLLYPEKWRNYKLKDVNPEIVFYSYILAYEKGMREAFDVSRFLREHQFNFYDLIESEANYLPGYLGYKLAYGKKKNCKSLSDLVAA